MTIFLGIVFWAVVIMWVANKAGETGTKVGTSIKYRSFFSAVEKLDKKYGCGASTGKYMVARHPRWNEYQVEYKGLERIYGI